jgi:hypothetical protein
MDQPTAGANPAHIAGTDFIMLHMDFLDDLNGDFQAALLFARIQFRAGTDGWWEATQERVQEDTRLSEHQLRRALNVLRDAGYVETRRRSAYDPTLKYRVILAETPETTVNEDSTVTRTEESRPVTEDFPVTVNEDFTVTTSSKNIEEQKQEPPIVPTDFDEFWKAYPRKKQRGQAEKTWSKVVKTTDPAVIICGAVQFRQWCEQDGKDAQFIPYPSTWLNGKGWLDERDPTPLTKQDAWVALFAETLDNENSQTLQLEG